MRGVRKANFANFRIVKIMFVLQTLFAPCAWRHKFHCGLAHTHWSWRLAFTDRYFGAWRWVAPSGRPRRRLDRLGVVQALAARFPRRARSVDLVLRGLSFTAVSPSARGVSCEFGCMRVLGREGYASAGRCLPRRSVVPTLR